MKIVTTAQMRDLDRRTIEEVGIPGEVLMERAGQGVTSAIHRAIDAAGFINPAIQLLAGRGNNGGDAFAVARMLKEAGFQPVLWMAGSTADIKGDALIHFNRMRQAEVPYQEVPTKDDWEDVLYDMPAGDIVVDGILGTGTRGPARGPAAGAIHYINHCAESALVVAIDVPSGLNADTGCPEGEAVRADITVTMGLPKTGLVAPEALEYVGTVEVIDIGLPADLVAEVTSDEKLELIHLADLRSLVPRRPRASHKGNYGRVLLVGGARGYTGAIAMAARAAVRSGAGLVTALVPRSIAPGVASASLETMVLDADETDEGSLSIRSIQRIVDLLPGFDALLMGPGMTRGEDTLAIVERTLETCRIPLALDADALAVLAGRAERVCKAAGPVVITPHPGELALLTGDDVQTIQADRLAAAEDAAARTGAVVVLKGAGTAVALTGRPVAINLTGNPGMATGGSGDVLAGLVVGLLGQGLAAFDAARTAVYLHGRAGDLVAWRKSQAGLSATDLIEEIPFAFRDISLR